MTRTLNRVREEYMKKLSSYKDKRIIKVLTGIRRSGKSTILDEFKKELMIIQIKLAKIIFF